MTQAKQRFASIEEYLDYDDGTDARYEVVNGELIVLPSEDPINATIAMLLVSCLLQLGISPRRFAIGHQIEVNSDEVTARQPDLVVHTEESIRTLLASGARLIHLNLLAPLLVVEIVSPGNPGSQNYDRDYIEKPQEYAARGIPEFWQVDPHRAVVIVLYLEGSAYREVGQFRDSDRILSPSFPSLQLTAAQILSVGE
jgi:Uma2 family endonuclease